MTENKRNFRPGALTLCQVFGARAADLVAGLVVAVLLAAAALEAVVAALAGGRRRRGGPTPPTPPIADRAPNGSPSSPADRGPRRNRWGFPAERGPADWIEL